MKVVSDQYVVDSKGRKKAVIVAAKRYEQIMEDLHDLAVVAERRTEGTISLDEMKRRLLPCPARLAGETLKSPAKMERSFRFRGTFAPLASRAERPRPLRNREDTSDTDVSGFVSPDISPGDIPRPRRMLTQHDTFQWKVSMNPTMVKSAGRQRQRIPDRLNEPSWQGIAEGEDAPEQFRRPPACGSGSTANAACPSARRKSCDLASCAAC